jgi:hypothetical protein
MLNGVNYQLGTSYTFTAADGVRLTSFSNASAISVSLPNGQNTGFQAGSIISLTNVGAGTVTITCSGCTINGGSTLSVTSNQSADLYSDGLNYAAAVGGGGAGGGALANQTTWAVSRNCGAQVNCSQIKADGRYVVDATSTSTTTVTCPNNDCNFSAGDVGKTVWATTQGTGFGIGFLIYTTYVCPVTTIATVNSAQSITLNLACLETIYLQARPFLSHSQLWAAINR